MEGLWVPAPARCPKGYKNSFPDIFSSQATQEASQRVFKALQVPLGAKILDFEGQLGSQDPPKIDIFELPRRILTQYMQKCENVIPAPTGTTFLFPRGCPKPSKNLSKIDLKSLLCCGAFSTPFQNAPGALLKASWRGS